MALATFPDDEQQAWRACTTELRETIRALASLRRPQKQRTRAGDYSQSLLWRERCQLRALYLLYGLLRGRTWQQIESGHPEPVPEMRPYLVMAWNALAKAGHTLPAPDEIASWL